MSQGPTFVNAALLTFSCVWRLIRYGAQQLAARGWRRVVSTARRLREVLSTEVAAESERLGLVTHSAEVLVRRSSTDYVETFGLTTHDRPLCNYISFSL